MPEEEAFCVLVQLMTKYKMREVYKPSMADLSLCFYQLERLIEVGCVCMCMCMCVYMCVHVCTCVHVCETSHCADAGAVSSSLNALQSSGE